jgi:SAM-dependent methyltransferase
MDAVRATNGVCCTATARRPLSLFESPGELLNQNTFYLGSGISLNILHKIKNKLHGLLGRYGPEAIRRWLWNREYASGRWNCLDSMPKDCVLPHLNAHARGGSILDIGCGPGAIGEAIDPTTYRHYLGVDISDVAIEKARAKNSRLNNIYALGDMWRFNPPGTYDLIFFGDSLYNFSFPDEKKILARYSSYLNEGGVFVIRTWVGVDRTYAINRTRAIIKLIESDYDVIEKRSYATRRPLPLVVIVFKPKGLQ